MQFSPLALSRRQRARALTQEGTDGLPYEFTMGELAERLSSLGGEVDARRVRRALPDAAKYRRQGRKSVFSNKDLLRQHAFELYAAVEFRLLHGRALRSTPDNDYGPAE
jgi:hypothetical protein